MKHTKSDIKENTMSNNTTVTLKDAPKSFWDSLGKKEKMNG